MHITTLMIEGVPPTYTNQDLKNLFARFGTVVSAEITRDPNGQSLRMGKVQMSLPQEAKKAKHTLNMSYLKGALLSVFPHPKCQ